MKNQVYFSILNIYCLIGANTQPYSQFYQEANYKPIDFKSCREEIAGALQEFCNR